MAITTKQQRVQRRNEALQLIADGVPPTDAATQLAQKWGCSRRTSLRDIKLAQSELANALNSIELQQMVGWLATQYQRLAAKAENFRCFPSFKVIIAGWIRKRFRTVGSTCASLF